MSRRLFPPCRFACLAAALLLLSGAAASAAEGMPQLNFANPLTLAQIVWGAIIFAVLYVIFARSSLPQVAEVLANRETRITGDLEAARDAKAAADTAVAEVNAATARARSEAQASINAAVEQAKKEAADRARVLNERLEQQLQTSEGQIAAARNSALGAIREVATDTARVMVSRLTGRTPDRQAIDDAVGQALAARGQA
ncbi:MAG: F0F1 ATP synthase subunit B' [Acetobacteraceae bacterium]|nr:F0F1 ATP synthase subunit B' [Acetobacteraceae bacterium]